MAFTGFEPGAIQFLVDLAENNAREWFQPRKGEFERLIKRPMEELCVALEHEFRARDIPLHETREALERVHNGESQGKVLIRVLPARE